MHLQLALQANSAQSISLLHSFQCCWLFIVSRLILTFTLQLVVNIFVLIKMQTYRFSLLLLRYSPTLHSPNAHCAHCSLQTDSKIKSFSDKMTILVRVDGLVRLENFMRPYGEAARAKQPAVGNKISTSSTSVKLLSRKWKHTNNFTKVHVKYSFSTRWLAVWRNISTLGDDKIAFYAFFGQLKLS